MKKSLKVLFFGNERIATGISTKPIVFSSLLESDHEVVGLVVHMSVATSRTKQTEPIVENATQHNVPIVNPMKLLDSIEDIKQFGADVGVLVAYGKIIPKSVIDLFPLGIINLHPSALPKLRGSTPIETTILDGEVTTAVSVMQLVPEMDAGPVLAQHEINLPSNVTKQGLADLLHEEGAKLLIAALSQLADGQITVDEQDPSEATFCTTIKKADGCIDWSKPAAQIEREIRAYAGWPTSFFEKNGQRYVVIHAEASQNNISEDIGTMVADDSTLKVQTSNGVVSVTTIQPAGKKEMPIRAFLNGYRTKLGL
jgi:methionyl-tRNA formyltransferase